MTEEQSSKANNTAVTTIANAIITRINNDISNHNIDTAAHTDKETQTNKVSAWNETPTNTNYPSEKLVKDTIDAILNRVRIHTEKTYVRDEDTININGFVMIDGMPKKGTVVNFYVIKEEEE